MAAPPDPAPAPGAATRNGSGPVASQPPDQASTNGSGPRAQPEPPPASAPSLPAEPSLAELAHRVDEATAALESLAPEARERAEAVKAAIEAFHRPALVAIVQGLKADLRGKELLFELVDDPAVRAVLSLHGIIRTSPPAPDGVGSTGPATPTTTFIPLTALGRRSARPAAAASGSAVDAAPAGHDRPDPRVGWVPGPARGEVPVGTMLRFDVVVEAVPSSFLVTNVAGEPAAFRNACAHQGRPLDGGLLDDGVLVCPWHGFRYDAVTGDCLSSPRSHLDAVPCRVDGDRIWLRASGG